MNVAKMGKLIQKYRKEKGLTQQELGDMLLVSAKAVSKWECGLGSPDISIIEKLSQVLSLDIGTLLKGEKEDSRMNNGNLKKGAFHICPTCGNIIWQTGDAKISCCGHTLEKQEAKIAKTKLLVEDLGDEYFIHSDHEMKKENYISFIATVSSDTATIKKLYPEWDCQTRMPKTRFSYLYFYSKQNGLEYQVLK